MQKKPMAEANRISAMLNAVFAGEDRFPVDVRGLALEYSRQCFPEEPIVSVEPLNIPGFEGLLACHSSKKKWKIGYNSSIKSPGRIRFTLAHELGHYLLHREGQRSFSCTQQDMHEWDEGDRKIESEADTFASFLLMPANDFRCQISSNGPSIDLLLHCSDRYGVSPMAAALKMVEIYPGRVVAVAAREGFVLWARSSKAAFKSGVYLASKKRLVEVPESSILNISSSAETRKTASQRAQLWFPKEPHSMALVEHIYVSEGNYPYTLGLLVLPDAVPKWQGDEEDELLHPISGHLKKW